MTFITLNTFNMHEKLNKTQEASFKAQIRESSKGYRCDIKAVCVCFNKYVNTRRKLIRFCKWKSVNVKNKRTERSYAHRCFHIF